jgi:hypothetical protein
VQLPAPPHLRPLLWLLLLLLLALLPLLMAQLQGMVWVGVAAGVCLPRNCGSGEGSAPQGHPHAATPAPPRTPEAGPMRGPAVLLMAHLGRMLPKVRGLMLTQLVVLVRTHMDGSLGESQEAT